MTIHRYHSHNFRFQLQHQKIMSDYNIAAVCCNSRVQEKMLSSYCFTSIQGKTISRFQNLGCYGKILGCHFDTQKRLKNHCKRQIGFRENHSTELAITTICDELLRNSDNKLIACSLFLDLSKAFVCCDHESLVNKLYHYGIRGFSHKLFSIFLRNRMRCTKIGAFKSSYKRIPCGVPQGSVISPLLFLMYINDITKASSFHTTSFADDINLHMSNSSFNVLQTAVNLELCKIDHWLRANKLSPNYNKTNFVLLNSQKHYPTSFKVIINNHSISPKDNLKYLRVLIYNKLSWKPHVQKWKINYQELVEFYPNLNIIQHNLYWKLSVTH